MQNLDRLSKLSSMWERYIYLNVSSFYNKPILDSPSSDIVLGSFRPLYMAFAVKFVDLKSIMFLRTFEKYSNNELNFGTVSVHRGSGHPYPQFPSWGEGISSPRSSRFHVSGEVRTQLLPLWTHPLWDTTEMPTHSVIPTPSWDTCSHIHTYPSMGYTTPWTYPSLGNPLPSTDI